MASSAPRGLRSDHVVTVGIALFSMLFGAGNLIIPPLLALQAGSATPVAMLGFLIAAIGLPVMGFIAVGPDKAVAVPLRKFNIHIFKQRFFSDSQRHITCTDHNLKDSFLPYKKCPVAYNAYLNKSAWKWQEMFAILGNGYIITGKTKKGGSR